MVLRCNCRWSVRPEGSGRRALWSPSLRCPAGRSGAAHLLRDFLSRNLAPFRWLDAETSDEARGLLGTVTHPQLPLVFLEDGTVLRAPELGALPRRSA